MVKVVTYDKEFLDLSLKWLNDPEIQELTRTYNVTKDKQLEWFNNINKVNNYKAYGIVYNNSKIGAAGLKHIKGKEQAEYWGYIGEKELWGKGIGKVVISEILKKAEDMEIKYVYLRVIENNLRAIKLYKSKGFKLKKQEDDILIMGKYL